MTLKELTADACHERLHPNPDPLSSQTLSLDDKDSIFIELLEILQRKNGQESQ